MLSFEIGQRESGLEIIRYILNNVFIFYIEKNDGKFVLPEARR